MENIQDTVKEIKQSFRLLMNGVTAQSMRDKGLDYRINWGVSLPHLQELAREYEPNKALAVELWKANVRECKILATMLMPKEAFDIELAILWIEQTQTQEIAEIAAMNLYQYMPYAEDLALMLIAKDKIMAQIHGFTILSRIYSKETSSKKTRNINEFLDQAITALQSDNISLKHSAWNAVSRFANNNNLHYLAAKNALKSIKMDDWL